MNTRLDTALQSLAGEAGTYGDPDGAIRAAQRRRVRSLVVAPLAIVLVIAVAVVAFVTFDVRRDSSPPAKPPTYPSKIDPPGSSTPDLPTTPVGRGLMVYQPCGGCPAYLVTSDGKQYKFSDPELVGSLSPDGRWLVYRQGRVTVIRELTSRHVRRVDGLLAWGWSLDSNWMTIQIGQGFGLYDPETGDTRPIKSGEDYWQMLAVISENEMVIGPFYGEEGVKDPDRETLQVVDPKTGRNIRTLHLNPNLRPQENLLWSRGLGSTDVYSTPTELLIPIRSQSGSSALLFSLEDGHTAARLDLPPDDTKTDESWRIIGFIGNEIFAIHTCPGKRLELVLFHSITGHQRVLSTLPVDAQIYWLATSGE